VAELELDEDEDEGDGGAAFFSASRMMGEYSLQMWMWSTFTRRARFLGDFVFTEVLSC
jgi:hypothetical protein